jgi:hypothetical protein
MTGGTSTMSTRWRRLLPGALIAATTVLGGSALADPATACAAPREWDIGEWDKCVRRVEIQ